MEPAKKEDCPDFEIGLIMAGAVSAGAYTAGVVDYLIETLVAWEKARDAGQDVPSHKVKIKVITGASAGGMTAAISVAEFKKRAEDPEAVALKDYRSQLYESWVEKIDIKELLTTKDLEDAGPIKSLLNARAIDKIASDVIPQGMQGWTPLPFLTDELKVYVTLSNLRGLPYEFNLKGETGFPYGMTDHSDYQYVELKKGMDKTDWVKLRNAAIATGAFPFGLASRLIKRDTAEYQERIFKDGRAISGLMKMKKDQNEPYHFVAVDGGTLNNEPIELARSVWEHVKEEEKVTMDNTEKYEKVKEDNEKEKEPIKAKYALIMVDPFPDLADMGKNPTEEDTGLINIVGPIVGALRSQSLFKIEELLRAGDREENNLFLVAPIRYTDTNTKALNAIACGFFGGFGGFLAQEFRHHDYELGRRNGQRFLQRYFVLTKDQAIKKGWTIHKEYVCSDPKTKIEYYPIIPIVKTDAKLMAAQGEANEWPSYKRHHAVELKKNLKTRIRALMKKALPFGWADSTAVLIIMIILGLLVVSGEFVKAARNSCDCVVVWEGLKNSYILLFQIILLLVLMVLLVLRACKWAIEGKVVKEAYNMFLKEMRDWGIKTKDI